MAGPEENKAHIGEDGGLIGPPADSGLAESNTLENNAVYFQATEQSRELPAPFGGARDLAISKETNQALDAEGQDPSREVETIGKDFAEKVSAQIRKGGVDSLQDEINNYTSKFRQTPADLRELIDSVVPVIAGQIEKDFKKNIEVSQNDAGDLVFSQLGSNGKETNAAAYHNNGDKFYEEKMGSGSKVIERTMFNLATGGRTIEYIEKYFPGSEKLQSKTTYLKDGKTRAMESVYEPGEFPRAKTTVFNSDGSKFGEVNRDLFRPPFFSRNLPDKDNGEESFSATLYGSDNKSIKLDALGFSKMHMRLLANGTAPEGIPVDKLKENVGTIARALSIGEKELFGKDFAEKLSSQIRKGGIGSLQDVINTYVGESHMPDGESQKILIDFAMPAIINQIGEDFKHKVTVTGSGEFQFYKFDSEGGKIEARYHSNGDKLCENEFSPDGKIVATAMFNPANNGRTVAYANQYYPNGKLQSSTSYYADGKNKYMEITHPPGNSPEAKSTVYNSDGSKFAEINRDLAIPPDYRSHLREQEKEKEPFSLTLYGSNNHSVKMDSEGFRELQMAFQASGKIPDGVPAAKLRENLRLFASTLPVVNLEQEMKSLAKDIQEQIDNGGVDTLEQVIKQHASKFIWMDGTSLLLHPKVLSEIQGGIKDVLVEKSEVGLEFSKFDSQGRKIRSAAYNLDGLKFNERQFDAKGKMTKEKIFLPRD